MSSEIVISQANYVEHEEELLLFDIPPPPDEPHPDDLAVANRAAIRDSRQFHDDSGDRSLLRQMEPKIWFDNDTGAASMQQLSKAARPNAPISINGSELIDRQFVCRTL